MVWDSNDNGLGRGLANEKPVGRERAKLKVEMDHEQSAGRKALLFDRIGDSFETREEKTSATSDAQAGIGK